MKNLKEMETVVNGYGFRVQKACRSCKHKECTNDGNRICQKMGLKVKPDFVCRLWEMADALKNAGLKISRKIIKL